MVKLEFSVGGGGYGEGGVMVKLECSVGGGGMVGWSEGGVMVKLECSVGGEVWWGAHGTHLRICICVYHIQYH